MSGTFRFHPELFDYRSRVMDALGEAGHQWLGGYGGVDLLHDEYGIEVCGIGDEQDAREIEVVLEGLFGDWYVGRWLKDWGGGGWRGDQGWCVRVCRDPFPSEGEQPIRRLNNYLARRRGNRRRGDAGDAGEG